MSGWGQVSLDMGKNTTRIWIESRQNLTESRSIREACFEKSVFLFLLNYSIPSLSVIVFPTNFSLYLSLQFSIASMVKNPPANAEDAGDTGFTPV